MNSTNLSSIAVFYPSFLGGGAEAVCLWMLEALKDNYDLTLFTISEVNINQLNQMYGTNLNEKYIKVKALFPKIPKPLINSLIANNHIIRMTLFHWIIRKLKKDINAYDLAISSYNAVDFGRPSIQYIHWIKVLDGNTFYEALSDFKKNRLKKNITLTNSFFVKEMVAKEYQLDASVVYPPVVLEPTNISWQDKEDAFICSGRLTKPKQPHKVIQILKQVRDKGFDIHLYLTGGGGGNYAWGYQSYLKKLINENSDWITLYTDLSYVDYVKVLTKCRYGIHVKQEPFGISIAEMVKAGVIPFVKDRGGQVEIVDRDNRNLLFREDRDAVEKIISVLESREKQTQLAQSLNSRKELFSTDKFMSQIRKEVDTYFQQSIIE